LWQYGRMLLHEIAEETGLHPQTIIRLEKRGFVKPSRDWNGWRRYSDHELKILHALLRGGRLVQESENNQP